MPTASEPRPRRRVSRTSWCGSTPCAAWSRALQGDMPGAVDLAADVTGPRRGDGRRRGQGEGGDRAGWSAWWQGDLDGARDLLERRRPRPPGALTFPVLAGLASRWLLLTLVDAGDWTAVEQLAHALLVRGDEAGDLHTAATAHHSMGVMARELGDLAEGRQVSRDGARARDRGSCAPRRESDDGPQPRDERVAAR